MVKRIVLEEPLVACQNELGEGCVWDSKTRLLHWVDIMRGEIHSLDPKTKAHSVDVFSDSDPLITALALRKKGPGLIGSQSSRLVYFPEPTAPSPIVADKRTERSSEVLPLVDEEGLTTPAKYAEDHKQGLARFNDGACDAKGRFWIGTTSYGAADAETDRGQLYRYDPDGTTHLMLENVGCSNGIGWSPDNKIMYYIDSNTSTIEAFDFDLDAGTISNRRLFIDSSAFDSGVWDGLCMDAEGAVWSARWDGSRVVRILPDGTIDTEIFIPKARNITCCIFGGDSVQDLFITSASCNQTDPSKIPEFPQGGDLFHVRIDGVKGVERFRFGA